MFLCCLLAVPLCAQVGCRSHARIHAEYAELRPARIDVRWPANRTVVPLDEVGFGGPLQRWSTGPRVYKVRQMLFWRVNETLLEKGYAVTDRLSKRDYSEIDFSRPVAEEGLELPFDAVLYTSIEGWSERKLPDTVDLALRVELYRVPGGEKLYDHLHHTHMGDRGKRSNGRFLETGLRRAAQRALAALPALE